MAKQVGKRFGWVIKNFSTLQYDKCYSVPFLIGDCKWRLSAYPRGDDISDYFSMFLEVADSESLSSGWRIYVKFRLTIVNQLWSKCYVHEAHRWFDREYLSWGATSKICHTKILDEEEGFLVNGELMIIADVEVISTLDESEESKEAKNPPKKRKLNDDGVRSNDNVKEASSVKECVEVNGFQVLPSQVESVRRIFERHPDIAAEFLAKNQLLRKACMSFLLSIIEMLCQSLEELSNEDLVEADIALTYLKGASFKVDWLEKKLEQVKEKKEKEVSELAQLQETEENLLKLKEKCSEIVALAEEQKAKLSATRTPLSFDDVV